jgi:ABC-type polysaccharide/polyol phosphate transport system ATPase subunit
MATASVSRSQSKSTYRHRSTSPGIPALALFAVGTRFHPELTGRENVALFAASLGIPRAAAQERLRAVAEFAGIEDHMDTP